MCVATIIDEASDLEACELLATNAENLCLKISETLRHTHTAYKKIDEPTRKKQGLSKIKTILGDSNQVSVYVLLQFLNTIAWYRHCWSGSLQFLCSIFIL